MGINKTMSGTSWHVENVKGGQSANSKYRRNCFNCVYSSGNWCNKNKMQLTNNNALVCSFFRNKEYYYPIIEDDSKDLNDVKTISYNNYLLSLLSNNKLKLVDNIYKKIFYICLKKKMNFQKIIFDCSRNIQKFQKNLINSGLDLNAVKKLYSPVDYVIMYLCEISKKLSCEVSELFEINHKKVDKYILKELLKLEPDSIDSFFVNLEYEDLGEWVKKAIIDLNFVENLFEFHDINFYGSRIRKVNILNVLTNELNNQEKLKLNKTLMSFERKVLRKRVRANEFRKHENEISYPIKFYISEVEEIINSPISKEVIENSLNISSNIAAISMNKNILLSEIIPETSNQILSFNNEILEVESKLKLRTGFIQDHICLIEYVVVYLQLIAEKLNCEPQEFFGLSTCDRNEMVDKFLNSKDVKKINTLFEKSMYLNKNFLKTSYFKFNDFGKVEYFPYYYDIVLDSKSKKKYQIIYSTFKEYFFTYDQTLKKCGYTKDVILSKKIMKD